MQEQPEESREHPDCPSVIGYARPADPAEGPQRMHPALVFTMGLLPPLPVGFVLLMMLSSMFRKAADEALIVYAVLMTGIPAAFLIPRSTRLFGAAWLTELAVLTFAVFVLCGRR